MTSIIEEKVGQKQISVLRSSARAQADGELKNCDIIYGCLLYVNNLKRRFWKFVFIDVDSHSGPLTKIVKSYESMFPFFKIYESFLFSF